MTREEMVDQVAKIVADDSLQFDDTAREIVNLLVPLPVPGTTDDKLRPGQTVKEALDRCIKIVGERRVDSSPHDLAQREFSIAIVHMEDAQMRYARGRHMQEGSFLPSDVDRWLADGKDLVEVRDERDRRAGKQS